MRPNDGDTIAVWFSCGAASAVAAKRTLELYGANCTVRVINSPVMEEDSDNMRFLRDVQEWLGVTIETAASSAYPSQSAVEVWARRQYMSGINGAPCTLELKKKARYEWEEKNPVQWHVLGFAAEEVRRYKNFILTERANTLPILIDGGITKAECFNVIQRAGIELPRIYKLGYPNANCIGCVKATSPTYWNHVRQVHPHVFQQRATQSRLLGVRLTRYKGLRVFLDELPADAKGRPMKNLTMPDCGIFCEEKPL